MAKTRENLTVYPREVFGKKVNRLRREGQVPATIYGPEVEGGISIQLAVKDFSKLLKKTGETELIDLQVDGESTIRPVLVYDVQTDPMHLLPLHVDFFQVNLKEEVEIDVPLEFIGESSAEKEKRGMLLEVMSELPIKVLPSDIPHAIEVDISILKEVGDQITVADLKIPAGVEVMVDEPTEQIIVKIEEIKEIEIEEPTEEVVEGEEGAEVVEGEGDEESTTTEDAATSGKE